MILALLLAASTGVSIVGHGARFELNLPAQAGHMPGGKGILGLAHRTPARVFNVMLLPGTGPAGKLEKHTDKKTDLVVLQFGEKGTSAILGTDMADESTVGHFSAGPESPRWEIESRGLRSPFPEGWALRGFVDPKSSWSWELYPTEGEQDAFMIYLRHLSGEEIPTPPELVRKGQTMVGSDADVSKARQWVETLAKGPHWIELAWQLGGESWRMRHYWVQLDSSSIALITAQAPEAKAKKTFEAASQIADGVSAAP